MQMQNCSPPLFRHSVCEVHSHSFYTNNPLLYISHYSEIIVTSGYNVAPPSGMLGQTLSARRELVEQLESSEPLFDYLVQNGALEPPTVEEIKNEKSAAKVNNPQWILRTNVSFSLTARSINE